MLQIDRLTIQLGSRLVLSEVSLELRVGEILSIIGPNGAGKSTLVRAAAGELRPRAGHVRVEGAEMYTLPIEQRARRVAVVPQAAHLPELFTAFEVVLMGRTPYLGWLAREGPTDVAIARRAMQRTAALELAARRVGELSGGERQRVLLARALAQSAPVLLLDEPTTHLDLKYQLSILDLIRDLAHRDGLAVLIVLHDLNLAAQYADRIALLSEGRLRAIGSAHQVLTSELLSPAYGLPIQVLPHPLHGRPLAAALPAHE